MKRVSEKLSSLTFSTYLLVLLVLWLTWGIMMAGSPLYSDLFGAMNSRLVRDWLLDTGSGSHLLKIWFTGLCLVMALLGVNLAFCTWNKILRIMKVKLSRPKFLMLVVHVIFGLVALGHFGSFMLGYRYERVVLGEGQSYGFRDGYGLKVERVCYVDSAATLEKSPREWLAGDFHYRRNFVEIVLSRNGGESFRDRVFVLRPARHEGIQITLARFAPPRGSQASGGKGSPRVVFVVSKNPVLIPFLVSYLVMIVGMAVYLMVTWRRPLRGVDGVRIHSRKEEATDGES